jgi:hypothetical protein
MAAHVDVSGSVRVAAPPDGAFRFFTPEGERLYVAGWAPEYLHPVDGSFAEGLTFRTHHGGEETLWLVSRCDVPREVDYIRVTPGSRMGVVSVRLTAAGADTSEVRVRYRLTSLSAAGDATLDAFASAFQDHLASWERSIDALLAAGR